MEMIFMNGGNIKTNELPILVHKLLQRLDLISSNNDVALQNLSIYYTWKNTRQQYKNNKLKIIAPTWNDEFELPDGSYSALDINDYIEYIIRNTKHYPLILLFIFTSRGLMVDHRSKRSNYKLLKPQNYLVAHKK